MKRFDRISLFSGKRALYIPVVKKDSLKAFRHLSVKPTATRSSIFNDTVT